MAQNGAEREQKQSDHEFHPLGGHRHWVVVWPRPGSGNDVGHHFDAAHRFVPGIAGHSADDEERD